MKKVTQLSTSQMKQIAGGLQATYVSWEGDGTGFGGGAGDVGGGSSWVDTAVAWVVETISYAFPPGPVVTGQCLNQSWSIQQVNFQLDQAAGRLAPSDGGTQPATPSGGSIWVDLPVGGPRN